MCWVHKVRFQGSLILEPHDAPKRIALPPWGDIWAHMGLKKSGNHPLESTNIFPGSFLLSVRCSLLPLKGEYVENSSGFVLPLRFWQVERQEAASDGGTASSQQCTAC